MQRAALPEAAAGGGGIRTVHGGVLWTEGTVLFLVRYKKHFYDTLCGEREF